MMQNIIRLKEFVAAAALTTGLVAVAPAWAGDAPTQGKAEISKPGTEKTKTITPEEFDRKLSEKFSAQSEQIKSAIDTALATQPKTNNDKIFGIQLPGKMTRDDANDYLSAFNLVMAILTVWSLILARRSVTQADESQKKADAHQKKLEKELVTLSTSVEKIQSFTREMNEFTNKTADYIRRAEKLTYRGQGNIELGAAIIHVNRTVRVLERRDERKERLGNFPYLFPYLSSRIQSAREQVIVKMPIYIFGAVGSPHGLKEFHHALYEQFSGAAAGKMQLAVMLYDDKRREALARSRYGRAVDALRLLNDRPLTANLLEIFNAETAKTLEREIENYRNGLSSKDRRQLYELAEHQILWEKNNKAAYNNLVTQKRGESQAHDANLSDEEIGDMLYYGRLGDDQGRALFSRVLNLRRTLSEAMAAQEMTYYRENETWAGQGTPWPERATVIRLEDEDFDNEITVCIDGKEIIRCFSNLTDLDSRDNRVVSELGYANVLAYKKDIVTLLKNNNVLEKYANVIKCLDDSILKAATKTKVEEILDEVQEIRRKIDEPKPEV